MLYIFSPAITATLVAMNHIMKMNSSYILKYGTT
jgi:hypothetical protein